MSHLAKYFENLTEPDFDRTSQLFLFCSFFFIFLLIFLAFIMAGYPLTYWRQAIIIRLQD